MSRRGVSVRQEDVRRIWIGAALLCAAALPAGARSTGIPGLSGNPATTGGLTCTACHGGGVPPLVTLSGPTLVAPGTLNTYTLTISGGQQIAGGLDVSTTAGTLAVNPADGGTRLQSGEITHRSPRTVNAGLDVVWSFDWQAPMLPGMATLYGAGNSVNLNGLDTGDAPDTTTLLITVAAMTGTPGETSAPGLQPLKVTAYNRATDELTISYESGCDTDDNNVYYGPLSQVSVYGWSNNICDIGNSGSAVIQPFGSSVFFVVVGNKDGKEGSYGLDQLPGNPPDPPNERPPIAVNTCGDVRDLTDACVP